MVYINGHFDSAIYAICVLAILFIYRKSACARVRRFNFEPGAMRSDVSASGESILHKPSHRVVSRR